MMRDLVDETPWPTLPTPAEELDELKERQKMNNDPRIAFEARYIPEPFSGCWLWTASSTKLGYGLFKHNGQSQYAHRASWQMFKGEIPKNIFVCHRCDTRSCVNPDHLFLGTQLDNLRDMSRKRRTHRLSSEQVSEIKASTESQRKLARRFGVSQSIIWRSRK